MILDQGNLSDPFVVFKCLVGPRGHIRSEASADTRAQVKNMLLECFGVEGATSDAISRVILALQEFGNLVGRAGLPQVYGDDFVRRVCHVLFGSDIRLSLLCPTPPFRRMLILGERGVGKERIARGIGLTLSALSGKAQAFHPVNAAALPGELLESTLFGHVKGAFTGAVRDRQGLLEIANGGGTVFLDEIADASAAVQAKLLRAVQYGEFSRVGDEEKVRTSRFHLIAATNLGELGLGTDRRLRLDLYDRLAAPAIRVPPLRDLIVDEGVARQILEWVVADVIDDLAGRGFGTEDGGSVGDSYADSFVAWATERSAGLVRQVASRMKGYLWPGNLREAAQVIRQVLYLGTERLDEVCGEVWGREEQCQPKVQPPHAAGLQLKVQIAALERELYTEATSHSDTIEEVAQCLGVTRQTASRALRKYGISLEGRKSTALIPSQERPQKYRSLH